MKHVIPTFVISPVQARRVAPLHSMLCTGALSEVSRGLSSTSRARLRYLPVAFEPPAARIRR